MTKENGKNGSIYKATITIVVFIAGIFTAAWAFEDRFDQKLETVRNENKIERQCIRGVEKTLARIEERLKNIQKQLDDNNK